MFTTGESMEIAIDVCGKYDIPIPGVIRYNARLKTTWARCLINPDEPADTVIEFNTNFCKINRDEIIIALLKHELAHLLHFNHGPGFKALCKRMGLRTHTYDLFDDIINPKLKYTYECPGCKKVFYETIKYKHRASCAVCDEEKFNKKYELVLMDQS